MMEKVYYLLFNADQNLGVLHFTITALLCICNELKRYVNFHFWNLKLYKFDCH